MSGVARTEAPCHVILGEGRGSSAPVNCRVADGFPACAENDEVTGKRTAN